MLLVVIYRAVSSSFGAEEFRSLFALPELVVPPTHWGSNQHELSSANRSGSDTGLRRRAHFVEPTLLREADCTYLDAVHITLTLDAVVDTRATARPIQIALDSPILASYTVPIASEPARLALGFAFCARLSGRRHHRSCLPRRSTAVQWEKAVNGGPVCFDFDYFPR